MLKSIRASLPFLLFATANGMASAEPAPGTIAVRDRAPLWPVAGSDDWQWLFALGACLAILALALVRLIWLSRQTARSSQQLKLLFEGLPEPVLILEAGKFVDCNAAAVAALGYADKSGILGKSPARLSPMLQPDGADSVTKEQAQLAALRKDAKLCFEWCHSKADGTPVLVEVTLLPFILRRRHAIVVVWHDITSRKRAEDTLRAERDLFSAGPVVVVTWAAEPGWPVRSVSSNCKEVLGYSAEELTEPAFRFDQLLHPEDLPRVKDEAAAQLGRTAAGIEQSYRIRKKNGDYAWYYQFTRLVRDGQGRTAGVRGYLFDQTRLKNLELSLEQERQSLSNVLWGTGIGTWEWNVQTGEVRINRRWAELLGYRFEELTPMSPEAWLRLAHADDAAKIDQLLRRHFAGEIADYECETRFRHRDGSWVWLLDRGRLVSRTAEGKPLWVAGTSYPITRRKLAEFELRSKTEALARSNAELEQFAYVASHDLRQPLRMINSYLQLLEKRLQGTLDSECRQMIGFVVDGATRMDQMLVSLLEYSRVGRKGQPLAAMPSRAAVDEALRFLTPAIIEAGAEIHLGPFWPTVLASRDELSRLFQNLIGNALKYRSPDRAPIITINTAEHAQGWLFRISDNGIGIDPEQFDRLFKVFQRLHTRSRYEGTGIGLALCRKIVERSGGTIWVESAGEGHGSDFCFVLPAVGSDAAGAPP